MREGRTTAQQYNPEDDEFLDEDSDEEYPYEEEYDGEKERPLLDKCDGGYGEITLALYGAILNNIHNGGLEATIGESAFKFVTLIDEGFADAELDPFIESLLPKLYLPHALQSMQEGGVLVAQLAEYSLNQLRNWPLIFGNEYEQMEFEESIAELEDAYRTLIFKEISYMAILGESPELLIRNIDSDESYFTEDILLQQGTIQIIAKKSAKQLHQYVKSGNLSYIALSNMPPEMTIEDIYHYTLKSYVAASESEEEKKEVTSPPSQVLKSRC